MVKGRRALITLQEIEQEQLKYRIRSVVKSIIKKKHEKENYEEDKRILRQLLSNPAITNATKVRYQDFAK